MGYTPAASPIRLEAARRHHDVVLAVQDLGPGIPDADRDRIFDQFTRLHPGEGLGLGLYVARSLARERLRSAVERGSGTRPGIRTQVRGLRLAPRAVNA